MPLDETINTLVNKASTDDWCNKALELNLEKDQLVHKLLEIATTSQLFQFSSQLISNPDLTLFDAEMWDLGKFETTPFFIGYCKKVFRDNTLSVIRSF